MIVNHDILAVVHKCQVFDNQLTNTGHPDCLVGGDVLVVRIQGWAKYFSYGRPME